MAKPSPFSDGYDLEAEAEALKDLLDAENPDTSDIRWARVIEYHQRMESLVSARHDYKHRSGADRLVDNREATLMRSIGGLEDEGQDSMLLHTREAYRLFMGRARDADGKYSPIIGGKRVASALRSAWALSGSDNPYADWILVAFMDQMDSARRELEQEIDGFLKQFEALRTRGLNYGLLRSRQPASVELGFKSPYGYSVAELIVQFDFFVRQVKTLIRKDRLSDEEGRSVIRKRVKGLRALFEHPSRYERFLMRPELRQLSRADWIPGADEEAGKRVQAVVGLFGEVPREVFTGAVKPKHSRRRANLTDVELKLLQEVALSPVVDEGVQVVEETLV